MLKFSITVGFLQFVSAELANKETRKAAQHAIRMSHVFSALIPILTSGNATQWMQAQAFAQGAKGSLAKAYRAGFAAVGTIGAMDREPGKVTPAVRAMAEAQAEKLAETFSAAFLTEAPLEAPEVTPEQLAERQARADAKVKARAAELGMIPGDSVKMLGVSESVDAMVAMLASGQVTGENLAALIKACKLAQAAAKPAAKPATV